MPIPYDVQYSETVVDRYIPDGSVIEFGLAPYDGGVNGDDARLASRYTWLLPNGKLCMRATWEPVAATAHRLRVVVEQMRRRGAHLL